VTTWAFSFVFPFLLVIAVLQRVTIRSGRDLRGWGSALVLGLISAGMVAIPVGDWPLARWMISFNANFSIPLTAILFAKVVEPFFGIKLLDDRALLTCWIFSIASGAALYPMALGLSELDPYAAGWEFSWLFVLMFFLTVVLLVMKNRFSLVGIAAILAYNLRLLESTNLWDYLVDPFLVVTACIAIVCRVRRNAQFEKRARGNQ